MSAARRLFVATLCVLVGGLVLSSVPAWASAPEAPVTGEANPVTTTTATLNGEVGELNPENALEVGTYEFLYRDSATTCEGGETAPVPAGGALSKEPVSQSLSGLLPGTQYTFCLLARNAASETAMGAPVTFTTHGAGITEEQVSTVEAAAATLRADIDPGGGETKYRFEYDTAPYTSGATHGTSITEEGENTEVNIGAETTPVTVEALLNGLQPGTTYYYRVVATDTIETFDGPNKTFITPPAPGSEPGQSCPNEQLRAGQPFGLNLPDCRAYEMVSPVETDGQDATLPAPAWAPRAAVSGEAITYASRGLFGEPKGGSLENQYVSRRGPEGWTTQTVSPLQDPFRGEPSVAFNGDVFTPELTKAIIGTNAPLVEGAPGGKEPEEYGLYVASFGDGSYQFVAPGVFPYGASSDLSRVMLENSEWINGTMVPVTVTNEGEAMSGTPGTPAPSNSFLSLKELWHAVSSDGSRVYFTSPANKQEPGVEQLFVRVNVGEPQSPIAEPEATGTGTLTSGSHTVSSLVTASGIIAEETQEGASEVSASASVGKFVVGQPLVGGGIAVGTTITAITGNELTLSKPTVSLIPDGSAVSSEGPEPFVVGEKVAGDGVPVGTTVTAVAAGSLTLSSAAASSGVGVALDGGGGCTVGGDACTIEVSGSQRLRSNPAGVAPARYWGASADGSRVFFTSTAELTEDAYTGPSGNAPNLYEYQLSSEPGEPGRLTDLSVTEAGDGAGVLGVAQISEDGSYVYFVAEGDLATGASAGEPNLYVFHEGAVRFITTLTTSDKRDWENGALHPETEAGPGVNTAVVNPSGRRLAFLSTASLTGYDNQQAQAGECEGSGEGGSCREVFLYDTETGGLVCASCNPSGARPVGPSSFGRLFAKGNGLYRPRNLLEDGVLFFETSDAVVPHASDGRENVYEYEHGRLHAVSNVAGGFESFFMDASPSGNDVFFGSSDQLLAQDRSENVVVWDARVDGGFPGIAAAPSCDNGDSCKPPASPQPGVFGAPASATFSGPGNPTAIVSPRASSPVVVRKTVKCAKGRHLSRGKCVKTKKVAKKVKRASNNRRTK